LTAYVARLTTIRRSSPDLHRDRFYRDGEVLWWHPAGRRIGGHDWHDGDLRTLGLLRGDWLLILHAGGDPMPYVLPPDGPFAPELDSTSPDGVPVDATPLAGGESVLLAARSLLLLRTP
jgi:isoamylase